VKILDRYILTSFIQTFVSVFVILFFIFILQAVWLFIADLAGKNLDVITIIKFLGFYAPKIVPLVLPLSILLASIMTFGSFSENYEFAAMKSSGISLNRAMRGLSIFIVILSIVAYFFANNVIPQAEFRFLNLRKNIIQKKPAMAIAEGQFNPVGDFNIRVDKKAGENGQNLTNVTIHKRRQGSASVTIIRSKTGRLKSSDKSNILQLELFDGWYYEEVAATNPVERKKQPFAKSTFKKQIMNIDLSQLNNENMDDQEISQTSNMLTVSDLHYTLDSLQDNYNKDKKNIANNIVQRPNNLFAPNRTAIPADSVKAVKKDSIPTNLLSLVPKADRLRVLEVSANNITSLDYIITTGEKELFEKTKNINNHWIALYEKYVIAYACILMFFIGAPLGAIIRKGGLGLPIVFAVLIFIVYHFVNTFGKKLAQENGITPFLGSWMSAFLLTPLAVLLTYRATNDMGVSINFDWITTPASKLFITKKLTAPSAVNLAAVQVRQDEDWQLMQTITDDALIAEVKKSNRLKFTYEHRVKLLKTLESRGITQEHLAEADNLHDSHFEMLQIYREKFTLSANLALIAYSIGLGLTAMGTLVKTNKTLVILAIITGAIFYFSVYKSAKQIKKSGRILHKKIGVNLILSLVIAFPFYIILYFYNKRALKNALSTYE
jgi:lipopolysaccharide export system permease protein